MSALINTSTEALLLQQREHFRGGYHAEHYTTSLDLLPGSSPGLSTDLSTVAAAAPTPFTDPTWRTIGKYSNLLIFILGLFTNPLVLWILSKKKIGSKCYIIMFSLIIYLHLIT